MVIRYRLSAYAREYQTRFAVRGRLLGPMAVGLLVWWSWCHDPLFFQAAHLAPRMLWRASESAVWYRRARREIMELVWRKQVVTPTSLRCCRCARASGERPRSHPEEAYQIELFREKGGGGLTRAGHIRTYIIKDPTRVSHVRHSWQAWGRIDN